MEPCATWTLEMSCLCLHALISRTRKCQKIPSQQRTSPCAAGSSWVTSTLGVLGQIMASTGRRCHGPGPKGGVVPQQAEVLGRFIAIHNKTEINKWWSQQPGAIFCHGPHNGGTEGKRQVWQWLLELLSQHSQENQTFQNKCKIPLC